MLPDDQAVAPDVNTRAPPTPPNNPYDNDKHHAFQDTPSREDSISIPVSALPPKRAWISFTSPLAEPDGRLSDATTERFTVLSYNVLCKNYATDENFSHSPARVRNWEYRKKLILDELINRDADILCLQEVEVAQYQDYFLPNLKDYDGVYWPKSEYKKASAEDQKQVDGCAIFFRKSKYTLLKKNLIELDTLAMLGSDFNKKDNVFDNRVLDKDNIAVLCLLESIETGTRFAVANTHIYWNPAEPDVKLVQVALLVDEIEMVINGFAKHNGDITTVTSDAGGLPTALDADPSKIPLILCGDFNSTPSSEVYKFLSKGGLSPADPNFMCGKYTTTGLRHNLELKSTYAGCGELPLTTHTPGFKNVIDYIWYGSANLEVHGALGGVDSSYLKDVEGLPNEHFPSDHICIMGAFHVKQQEGHPSLHHF